MAKQTGKGNVAGAIAAIKKAAPGAYKKHKDDETVIKGGGLPEGINNGVAKFNSFTIDKTEKGVPFLSLKSICIQPKTHNGLKCEGLGVRKTIYFEGTRDGSKTVADRVAEASNELRKLGCDLTGTTEDDWADLLQEKVDNPTYHRFHTWKGDATKQYPNPKVKHEFDGVSGLEDYSPEDGDDVEDETGDVEESADDEETEVETEEEETDTDLDSTEEEDTEEADETPDYQALAKAADKKNDKKAAAALTKACKEAGLDPNDYETWKDAADALGESSNDEDEEEDDEDEEQEAAVDPQVGDIFKYKPAGLKRAVECEVLKGSVNKAKKLVNLKSLDDNKIYKNVSWDALVSP